VTERRTFEALVESIGPGGAWSRINVPVEATAPWGTKARLAVRGTLNGFAYRSSIFPNGDGTFHMMFSKAMQAGARAGPGDPVRVVMERDDAPREVETPPDLVEALDANEAAAGTWSRFSVSTRQEYVEWLLGAKAEATRARRLRRAVEMIGAGKRLKG
jgi:hypothetical protein